VGIGLRRAGKNLVLIGKNRFANPLSLVESCSISLLIPRKKLLAFLPASAQGLSPGFSANAGTDPMQKTLGKSAR